MTRHKKELEKHLNSWKRNVLDPVLDGYPERKKEFRTTSLIEKKRIYTPLDGHDRDYVDSLGFSGEFPYTRGVQPTMYRGKLWTMRQYAGFGTAESSNERFAYLLSQGQTGLSVAFDLPTQMGYDADHPLSEGEVGKVGVSVCSLEDMELLFKGIPLNEVSTSMTINSPAAILLAMYISLAEKQGVAPGELSGTIQNDVLKEYVARGTYIFPPEPSMRIFADIVSFCTNNLPQWNTISISGYHIREAGATAAQEVGFTLANGIAYVQAAIDAGLSVDRFGPRLSFFFNVHNDLFEEIAKFRAARRMWAGIMRDRFHARNPDAQKLRFHAQTGGSTLTAQAPENNIVRVALQALSAVAGGAQSLHTNGYDEALAIPSERAVRLALRTQQILAFESGVPDVVDPFGGSYYLESLTDALEKEATLCLKKIDDLGGAVRAIETGYIQSEIQKSAYAHQLGVENNDRIVVGVNKFGEEDNGETETVQLDTRIQEKQIVRLKKLKMHRNNMAVQQALDQVKACALNRDDNLMPHIVDAVKTYATVGEICDALRSVFGRYNAQHSL